MNLIDILNELTAHCCLITGKQCELKLILPDKVIEEFSKEFKPKERIVLFGQDPETPESNIRYVNGIGGTVKLIKESEIE